MKRSEMVNKITLMLEIQSLQGTSYRFKAEQILQDIEHHGMLPPVRYRHPDDKDWYEGFAPVVFESNTWEPENV